MPRVKKQQPVDDVRMKPVATSNELIGLERFIEREYPNLGKAKASNNGIVTLNGCVADRFFVGVQKPKNTPIIYTLYERKGAGE